MQAAVLLAGVIVVVMKSVLLRRRPQVFIKRKLNPSGQIARSRSGEVFAAAEKKGCKWRFQVYTLLKIFFALKVHFWVCDRLEMSFW